MKNMSHHNELCEPVTSLLITGIQMREMSKLGWLIELVNRAMWMNLCISYNC
jgi:hypothetical protein